MATVVPLVVGIRKSILLSVCGALAPTKVNTYGQKVALVNMSGIGVKVNFSSTCVSL